MPTLYQRALKTHKHTGDTATLRRMALRSVFDNLEKSLKAEVSPGGAVLAPRWDYLAKAHGVSLHTVSSWIRNGGMPLSAAMLFESRYGAARCAAQELVTVPHTKEKHSDQ